MSASSWAGSAWWCEASNAHAGSGSAHRHRHRKRRRRLAGRPGSGVGLVGPAGGARELGRFCVAAALIGGRGRRVRRGCVGFRVASAPFGQMGRFARGRPCRRHRWRRSGGPRRSRLRLEEGGGCGRRPLRRGGGGGGLGSGGGRRRRRDLRMLDGRGGVQHLDDARRAVAAERLAQHQRAGVVHHGGAGGGAEQAGGRRAVPGVASSGVVQIADQKVAILADPHFEGPIRAQARPEEPGQAPQHLGVFLGKAEKAAKQPFHRACSGRFLGHRRSGGAGVARGNGGGDEPSRRCIGPVLHVHHPPAQLILLCHNLFARVCCFCRQQGQRGSARMRSTVRRRRMLAIECGTCRSSRAGTARLEASG